jgi:NTP pyrophosphatase (non-canonical NTP hydrolase)
MSYGIPSVTASTTRGSGVIVRPKPSVGGAVTAVLCGSFRRDTDTLRSDFRLLVERGCRVLSPMTLDWTVERDGFVFSADEEAEDPRDIEQKHLTAMRQAHFVWLHAPAGYVGRSAAMEVGYANALGLPIFTRTLPEDITIAGLVRRVDSVGSAIAAISSGDISAPADGLDALQRYYHRAAEARGWSHEGVQECLAFLHEELGELTEAIRTHGYRSREAALEMADIQLYVAHLANVAGTNLGQAVIEKEHINSQRFGPVVPWEV